MVWVVSHERGKVGQGGCLDLGPHAVRTLGLAKGGWDIVGGPLEARGSREQGGVRSFGSVA